MTLTVKSMTVQKIYCSCLDVLEKTIVTVQKMAKRKRGNVPGRVQSTGFEDKSASRLAVKNFEDVADSEDEFFINKDKILLEDGPDAKRRKQLRSIGMFQATYRAFNSHVLNQGNSTTNGMA